MATGLMCATYAAKPARPLRIIPMLVMMAMAAIILLGSGLASVASAADERKLFCSHPSKRGGVIVVQSFAEDGENGSKIINASAILTQVIQSLSYDPVTQKGLNWTGSFTAIAGKVSSTVGAALLLYVVIFGVMMVFNMVNLTWYEVFIRIAKVGVVYYLLFSGGMENVVAKFIMGGMNELIDAYYAATIQKVIPAGSLNPSLQPMLTIKPLAFLIAPMEKVMTLQFICSALALIVAGTAGLGLGLFLMFGLFSFFMAIIGAVATYIKASIGLAILFAISPIFIACLLFEQTRRLFDGWLSMCLNFALQPVFVFAFLGFFMVMLDGALKPLTNMYWCYGPVYKLGWLDFSFYFPVPAEYFVDTGGPVQPVLLWDGNTKVPELNIDYGMTVKDLWKAAGVDLYVVDVLMFCLLSTLCWRYSEYTSQIAREIVGGGVSIAVSGQQIQQMMANNGLDPKGLMGRATEGAKGLGDQVSGMFSNMTKETKAADVQRNVTDMLKGERK